MPVSTYSSTPRVNFRGVKDEASVNLTMPVQSLPIRLPLFMSFAPWGPTDVAHYVDSAGLQLVYGNEVISPISKFFNHQSLFTRTQFTGGGKALFLRLPTVDGKRATFRLALDAVADDVKLYQRNPDGSLKLDQNGQKVETGETVAGFRVQWRLIPISKNEDGTLSYGSAAPAEGSMTSSTGVESTQTPIWDGLARFDGDKGNNLGFRLIAPTINSTDAADEDLQETLGAFLYRLQIVQRDNAASTATLKRTLGGDNYVDFSFKKGTVDLENNIQYYGGRNIQPKYESKDPTAFTGWGPFEKTAFYDKNIQDLLKQFSDAEAAHTGEEFADVNLFNFLTGVDINGNPYHTFSVEGPTDGGLLFGELSNHFMQGGSDGTVDVDAYNAVVANTLNNLADSAVPFKDIARMPYDSVWDTGFPTATKKLFANFTAIRPDVMVHACTQDVTQPLNTPSQDSSIAVTLRSHYRSTQESSEFGTKALRFALVGNAGYLIDDEYDGIVPFLEWLCEKGAEYMGAESGEMNSDNSFGRGEQNIIDRYRDHNVVTRDIEVKNTDWNNGLNYAEWFDINRVFFAGLQSIYEDHKSVLHGYINTVIACNLTRIGHIVWRECSGDSQLTNDEFIDMVNDKVTAKTTGKYDGRVEVTSNAYFTDLDTALGFPWHLDIGMAGDNIRTTENLAIIAQRRRNEVTV